MERQGTDFPCITILHYVLEMEKIYGFRSRCKKLLEKLLFCACESIQFKKPVRIFDQNFKVKNTVI